MQYMLCEKWYVQIGKPGNLLQRTILFARGIVHPVNL